MAVTRKVCIFAVDNRVLNPKQSIMDIQELTVDEQTTVFTPAQLHLLKLFSFMKSEEQLDEMKQVLCDYYFKKVEEGMAELEAKGLWGREQSEAIMKEHLRTPYVY